MYDLILFDLDDTLLDFSGSEAVSLQDIHRRYYTTADYDFFLTKYTKINQDLWSRVGAEQDPLKPGQVKTMRFEQLNQALDYSTAPGDIAQSYEVLLGENAQWYPGVERAISFLHGQGHVLGIVTNGLVSVQTRKYQRHGLERWFDCFVISDEVGYAKPEKEIFDCAFQRLAQKRSMPVTSLKSGKVLMVGDSLTSDGQGAKACGMDFCLVSKHPQPLNRHGFFVDHQVQSVAELPKILGYESF